LAPCGNDIAEGEEPAINAVIPSRQASIQ